MNPKEALKIALTALYANKVRSLLTILGIVIGVSSVILLISIGSGLRNYITSQLEGLGAEAVFVMPGEINVGGGEGMQGAGAANAKFTFNHLESLKREAKLLTHVMPYIENNGTFRYKGKTYITQVAGVDANYPIIRSQKAEKGAFFSQSQYNSAKKVVALGKTVADELFSEAIDPIGKKITISNQRYTVVAVMEEKGGFGGLNMDNQAFIPATTAMRQFDLQYIMSLWAKAKDADSVPQAKKEVEIILLKSLQDDEFSVLDTKSILNVVGNILSLITVALAGIAAISLLVGGIGIMNIMLVSVTERTKEIGLRKAVGAAPKDILSQFLTESAFLSIAGGIIGIAAGAGISLLLNRFLQTSLTFWSIALAFGVSALVGVSAGVGPALKASRKNPIDALRYE